MRVLITGSSGLIGSELVGYFDSRADCMAGIDNNMRADFFGAEQASRGDHMCYITDLSRMRSHYPTGTSRAHWRTW